MRSHRPASMILLSLTLLTCTQFVLAAESIQDAFDLKQRNISGTVVYYQQDFAAKLDAFEKIYLEFLGDIQNSQEVSQRVDQILAQVNDLVGDGMPEEQQRKLLKNLQVDYRPQGKTFYLLLQKHIKDYLKQGNTLPAFSYDAAEDMVTYNPSMIKIDQETRKEDFELAFPISSVDEFDDDCQGVFDMVSQGFGVMGCMAIHEVAELSLVLHIKPTDPYWRWFSDGVANVVTYRVLADCIGKPQAEEFISAYDPNQYKDIKDQINLQYWMSAQYCIKTPIESQERLIHARYAYATHEVQYLVSEHGWDKFRTIKEKAAQGQTRDANDLMHIIKEVTGLDMLPRMAAYQTFSTRVEGIRKYAGAYNAAEKSRDYCAMIENILRVQELHEKQLNQNGLMTWKNTAMFLARLGHTAAADQAMADCMKLFTGTEHPDAIKAAQEAYLMYAVQTQQAQKARDMAQAFLQDNPDNVWALSVQMVNLAQDAEIGSAIPIAQKILGLSKQGQVPHYIASTFIESLQKME